MHLLIQWNLFGQRSVGPNFHSPEAARVGGKIESNLEFQASGATGWAGPSRGETWSKVSPGPRRAAARLGWVNVRSIGSTTHLTGTRLGKSPGARDREPGRLPTSAGDETRLRLGRVPPQSLGDPRTINIVERKRPLEGNLLG